jgi:hypothetical protein
MKNRFGISPGAITATGGGPEGTASLYDAERLSPSNPTILVLPHIFVEALRNYDRLFRDFLTWIRETIRFARTQTDYNWLIKPHPHRASYVDCMNQDIFSEVSDIIEDASAHTVTFVAEEVSAATLLKETDVVLTMDGTGGIEYSCYGIPTVLASGSAYSGFGFTHEPTSQADYFETLASAGDIPQLSDHMVKRAKIFAYVYFDLIRNQWPSYPTDEESNWKRAETFLERVRTSNLEDAVSAFVDENRTHLIGPDELAMF